jgi:hypothetical protein
MNYDRLYRNVTIWVAIIAIAIVAGGALAGYGW